MSNTKSVQPKSSKTEPDIKLNAKNLENSSSFSFENNEWDSQIVQLLFFNQKENRKIVI
jgi:hypothetical protein